jgi:hypothetical protein
VIPGPAPPLHLKDRFQAGATPEMAARFKTITVDPKTVVLKK